MTRKEIPNIISETEKTQNDKERIKIVTGTAEEVISALKKMKEVGAKTVSGIYVFESGEKSERKINIENLDLEKTAVNGNFIIFEVNGLPMVKAPLEFKGIMEIKKIETRKDRKMKKRAEKTGK